MGLFEDLAGIVLHKINAADAYVNGAYDEDGDVAVCDCCGEELEFVDGEWECSGCGQIMDRSTFLNHIGAEPPSKCDGCDGNYPVCRNWCDK